MSLMSQTGSVIMMNVRSIPQRLWMSVASVVSIALVVAVLLGFLALANGFSQTLKGSGSPNVVIVLRDGSGSELNSVIGRDQIDLLASGPSIKLQPKTHHSVRVPPSKAKKPSERNTKMAMASLPSSRHSATRPPAPAPAPRPPRQRRPVVPTSSTCTCTA